MKSVFCFAFAVSVVTCVLTCGSSSLVDRDDTPISIQLSGVKETGRMRNLRDNPSGSLGGNLTWTFDLDSNTLMINGTGNMTNYETFNYPWYSNRQSIVSIVIEEGVTSIGDNAFYDCSSVRSLIIPYGVTSIGAGSFQYCENLVSVTLPTTLKYIGDFGFTSCFNLKTISIPSSVTTLGRNAFCVCNSLKSVFIPAKLTSIGSSPFCGCLKLETITVDESNPRYKSYDGVLFDVKKHVLMQYPAGKKR